MSGRTGSASGLPSAQEEARWTACRSATMRCCRTAAPPRWSAATARWTGCAPLGLTGRQCSAGCLTRREIRGEPRDFLYSKLMCWVALDCAIALAGHIGAEDRVTRWAAIREEIRAAILERGWNDRVGAFTQSFGSDDLDASSLMLTISGFLAADDPRMKATIAAIAQRLTDKNGMVYRYLACGGLPGEEGTFLLCTFWLAQAQALAGDVEAATATFERAVAAINDVGLLAEEVDPAPAR